MEDGFTQPEGAPDRAKGGEIKMTSLPPFWPFRAVYLHHEPVIQAPLYHGVS